MISTIILYANTEITPERNFIVEDIAEYLAKRSQITLTNFQYQRNSLQHQIKVNFSQVAVNYTYESGFNYCSIINEGTKPVYYFIVKKTQIAENTILFDLVMDVCNSFEFMVDYQFTLKSRIIREHKDRFYNTNTLSELRRKIDFYSEGLNPTLYKEGDDFKLTSNKWSLIFKNQTEVSDTTNNPVLVYAAPEFECSIQTGSNFTLTPDNLIAQTSSEPHQYYFSYDLNPSGTFIANGATYTLNSTTQRVLLMYTDGTTLTAVFLKYTDTGEYVGLGSSVSNSGTITFTNGTTITRTDVALTTIQFPLSLINGSNLTINFNAGAGTVRSNQLSDVDRTDPTLLKIIKLPYPPFTESYSSNAIVLPEGWIFDSSLNLLRLSNINVPLTSAFGPAYDTSHFGFPELYYVPDTISPTQGRDYEAESKMFHSEFYQKKFVYDSYSYQFQLEKIPYVEGSNGPFAVSFKCTSTINSRFMFDFKSYNEGSYATQDYPYVMLVTRNNEATLFNNAYVNYINNAYNYDLKTNERNVTANWISVGLNGIATGINLGTGSDSISVASATSLGKQTIVGIYNAISSQEQMEQNLEAKKAQLMTQATSVIGSDDVDLMESYSGNEAKIVTYTPSEKLYQSILDLFHYTGYISNEMKVPEVNTRYWFNYLQADPQIVPIANLSNDIIVELQNRFKEGMTFLHHHDTTRVGWDFNQTYENWETWIIDLL